MSDNEGLEAEAPLSEVDDEEATRGIPLADDCCGSASLSSYDPSTPRDQDADACAAVACMHDVIQKGVRERIVLADVPP